jgi:rSAM/selenodomain-associated transferase 1
MSKALIIVFVKNLEVGTVKTRLAKTIGHIGAYEVYTELVKLTEEVTTKINIDRHIYFSKSIVSSLWPNDDKYVQSGMDLGERMLNAFEAGFDLGYDKVILIGSDLPDLNSSLLESAFSKLDSADLVFGPAEDGGYYLIGMTTLMPFIFKNKPWSQPHLLELTLKELERHNNSVALLNPLNDIDTFEDLIHSNFYKSNVKLQEKIQALND